ncbi:MAG: hypothetical protein ABFE13_19230 [Phycisphaerales bacterium]
MPQDLTLDGDEETFTITVAYDTLQLYGTVTTSREFTVCKN